VSDVIILFIRSVAMTSAHDLRLKSPFTAIIAGPTGSGKSRLVRRLIRNIGHVNDIQPDRIVYCYGIWQDWFNEMTGVTFHQGVVDFEKEFLADGHHKWLVLDDLMSEIAERSADVERLFSRTSHHRNVSAFLIAQNIFLKNLRTITLNAHYLFLFKNPRDTSQIVHLGQQLYPTNLNFLAKAYADATETPYSYLFLDLKQSTKEDLRVLGNFATEDDSLPIVAYAFK
jgi:energy-coupling factor transporter ATP-binding protein EcfA2